MEDGGPGDDTFADDAEFFAALDGFDEQVFQVIGSAVRAGSVQALDDALAVLDRQFLGAPSEPLLNPYDDLRMAAARHGRAMLRLERYRRLGELADLSGALDDSRAVFEQCWADAVLPVPPRRRAMYRGTYGEALADQYRFTQSFRHLEESIQHLEQAVGLDPQQPADRMRLAMSYADRMRAPLNPAPDQSDLDRAITLMSEALSQMKDDDVNRPAAEGALGAFHHERYVRRAARSDLRAALEFTARAIRRTQGTPDVVAHHLHHAHALRRAFESTGSPADRSAAVNAYLSAAREGERFGSPFGVDAAGTLTFWAAAWGGWDKAAEAGEIGLRTIEELVRRQPRASDKEAWLGVRGASGLAAETAYAYLMRQNPRDAVLALEHGRAIVLSDRFPDVRPYLGALAAHGRADLIERFQEVTRRLGDEALPDTTLRELEHERQILLDEIRHASGVDVLPQPTAFGDLTAAADGAPLCYVFAASRGGAALTVAADGSVQALLLPSLTLANLIGEFRHYRRDVHAPASGLQFRRRGIHRMCGWLGAALMQPLSASLREAPRVVLVPAGLLAVLPLHAAWWDVDGGRRYAIEDRLWTYAPNGRGHLAARRRSASAAGERLLAVQDPQPVQLPALRGAAAEVAAARSHFPRHRVLHGPSASRERVIYALPESDVLHFACHGLADMHDPMHSALVLAHDTRLSLGELLSIIGLDRVRLTVLSACQTNIPSDRLPDETSSLAAGLLFAGSAAVVGSFWPVPDTPTAALMAEFYRCWRRAGQPPAEALRQAQLLLLHAPRDAAANRIGWDHPYAWGAFSYLGW